MCTRMGVACAKLAVLLLCSPNIQYSFAVAVCCAGHGMHGWSTSGACIVGTWGAAPGCAGLTRPQMFFFWCNWEQAAARCRLKIRSVCRLPANTHAPGCVALCCSLCSARHKHVAGPHTLYCALYQALPVALSYLVLLGCAPSAADAAAAFATALSVVVGCSSAVQPRVPRARCAAA